MDEDPFDELRRGLGGDGVGDRGERRVDVRHLLAGVAAVVVLGGAVVLITAVRPGGGGESPAPQAIEVTNEPVDTTSPPVAARIWPSEPVEVAGTEVRTGGHRWTVGQPGDLVAVADWDCDGSATPAILRPGAPQLYVFDAWATAEAPTTATLGPPVPRGATSLAAPAGCGQAVVGTSDGAFVTIAIEP